MVELDDMYMKSYLKVASSDVSNMTSTDMSTDMSSGATRILARSDDDSPVKEDLKIEQIMINSSESFLKCAEDSQNKFDKKFSRTQTELLACLAN